MSTAQRTRRCLLVYAVGLLAVLGVSQVSPSGAPAPATTADTQQQ